MSQGAEYGDRSKFPVHWNQFLAEKNLSDGHKEVANTEANDNGDSIDEGKENYFQLHFNHIGLIFFLTLWKSITIHP